MKQAALALNLSVKKTRKRWFLEQMVQVVPWAALVANIRSARSAQLAQSLRAALCIES